MNLTWRNDAQGQWSAARDNFRCYIQTKLIGRRIHYTATIFTSAPFHRYAGMIFNQTCFSLLAAQATIELELQCRPSVNSPTGKPERVENARSSSQGCDAQSGFAPAGARRESQ